MLFNKKVLLGISSLAIASLPLLNPVAVSADGPTQPFSFQATSGTQNGTVNLTWSDPQNQANSYSLIYGYNPNPSRFGVTSIAEGTGGNTSFNVGYLNPGTTYYFILNAFQNGNFVATTGPVKAVAPSGPISVAAAGSGTTMAAAPTTTTAAMSTNPWVVNPTFGFWATKGSQPGTINLTWSDPQNMANNYQISYGTTSAANMWGALNISETPGGNNLTVGSLVPGQTYYFTLYSYNGGNFVKTSATVSAVAR